jgi:hypothetical protein
MHAAILADAFGTPWVGVSVSHVFNGAKWLDWADSVGVVPRIRPMFPTMEAVARLVPKGPRPEPTRSPAPAASAASRVQRKLPLRLRVRIFLERQQAVSRLKALAREPGQLSDRDALDAAKAHYRAALSAFTEGIMR